jgi:hypothetical protein
MNIPVTIIFHINTYLPYHFLLNNKYKTYIEQEKRRFIKNPLIINYRLSRHRYTTSNSNYVYSKYKDCMIKIGNTKKMYLNGNISLRDIFLYNIVDNKIIPSKILKKHVVPEPNRLLYPYYMWGICPSVYINIKWDIYDMTLDDLERTILYKFLFS